MAISNDRPLGPSNAQFERVGICWKCARLTNATACEAFPSGIPLKILVGEIDHRQPVFGDHGLTFKANGRK